VSIGALNNHFWVGVAEGSPFEAAGSPFESEALSPSVERHRSSAVWSQTAGGLDLPVEPMNCTSAGAGVSSPEQIPGRLYDTPRIDVSANLVQIVNAERRHVVLSRTNGMVSRHNHCFSISVLEWTGESSTLAICSCRSSCQRWHE
jgi:hypothetical protein